MANAATKKTNRSCYINWTANNCKNFVNQVARKLEIKINWKGKGVNELFFDNSGKVVVACDKTYYRPLEVNNLLGDSKKAKKLLNWKPKTNLDELISEMVNLEMSRSN